MSALYGSDAVGGVIQVFTRAGAANSPGMLGASERYSSSLQSTWGSRGMLQLPGFSAGSPSHSMPVCSLAASEAMHCRLRMRANLGGVLILMRIAIDNRAQTPRRVGT